MHRTDRNDSATAEDRDVVRVERRADESTTAAVLRGVAAITGGAQTESGPLYEQVEPDALNQMVRHAERQDSVVNVRFRFGEYTVRVNGDGQIRIVDGSHPLALRDEGEWTRDGRP